MTDMRPAWLIENPKASLFLGTVAAGRGAWNGSLRWGGMAREPRAAAPSDVTHDHDDEAATTSPRSSEIDINITFDVNNSLILITLTIILAVYLATTIVLIAKRWWGGRKPLYILKWPPTNIKSANPYLVTIVTGSKTDSETDGTFVFSIHGLKNSSEQYYINGRTVQHDQKLLGKCGTDSFLITCDEPLGSISEVSVHLWASDPVDKLFLNYITIQDIRGNVFIYLPLHKWIPSTEVGTGEVMIKAKHEKTVNQAMDNLMSGFRERDIWLAPWLSTTMGSKLDSVYNVTLCYLTTTCFTFAAVLYFYKSYDKQHGYVSPPAVNYVAITAVIVTCIVTFFHMAMRWVRVATGDFGERYSPVLLRDMSASLHVHWDMDAEKGHKGRSSKGPKADGHRLRKVNAQQNNSNSDGPPSRETRRLRSLIHCETGASDDGQYNNNNNNRSRGDIFRAFPSSCLRATADDPKPNFAPAPERACFAPSADDVSTIRENFAKTRFQGSKASMSTCKPSSVQGTPFDYKTKNLDLLGSWGRLGRSNSGLGAGGGGGSKGAATSSRVTSRRYDSYLDVRGGGGGGTACAPQRRSTFLKSTNSDLDSSIFPFHPMSGPPTGPAGAGRSVGFRCSVDGDDDVCSSRYLPKKSNYDSSKRSIFGSSLQRSDDWKTPSTGAGVSNDTRFSSRSYGQSTRTRANDPRLSRNRSAYDDDCWGLGDRTPREDYVERSMCGGMASTKRFSKQTDGDYMDRFRSNRSAERDQRFGPSPTFSSSFQRSSDARQLRESIEQDLCNNFKNAERKCRDFQGPGRARSQGGDVEHSWNDLWTRVKPRDDGSGPAKGDKKAKHVCQASGEVSGPVLQEMRGFAGQLVENIIAKIKKQLTSPDQCVDLADCEFDIESFVRRMTMRMVGTGPTDSSCGKPNFSCGKPDSSCGKPAFSCGQSDPCDAPREQRYTDCSGGATSPDPLTDRVAQTVADGALKNSMAMLDERVASIVKDVEKVRGNIIERMRMELGLGPEDDDKEFRQQTGRNVGMSASDTSVMTSKGKADKYGGSGYLPHDDISSAMTDAKLNKVARASLDNVLNRDGLNSMRDNAKATSEGDLKNFANDVVQSLYLAVRTKLQQMLKHEYDMADEGTVPFPTEELLKKADLEVQEQVLPTVVEHIVWLMREEAKALGQLDCDMMMIAFAGQYVDTIVTNAVLKTHVDLSQKRAYTRTFVVTSNSNKTNTTQSSNNNGNNNNNNNNNLDSVLERCLSETTLSLETLGSLSATRLEVEEVLRETCVASYEGSVDYDLVQLHILCSLVEKFITRLRVARGVLDNAGSETAVVRVGDANPDRDGWDEGEEAASCPYCRAEAARGVVTRCLTPISAKLITDLILEEATKNLDACGRMVESNLVHCNQEAMVALGRALLDGSGGSGEHMMILESVTADLKAVALDQATAKVVDDLMAIGDASRTEAERELRGRLSRFTNDARKRTEKIMMQTAIKENHQQNNALIEVDFYPRSENNINYNAATPATTATEEGKGAGDEQSNPPDTSAKGKDAPEDDALDPEDDDNIVDEMIGVHNSLTRIADEDECLTGKCRRHRGRLSRSLPSSRCDALHFGKIQVTNDPMRTTTAHLSQTLNDIEGTTLSDLWRDPNAFRHRCLVLVGNLILGGVLLLVVCLVLGCVFLGLQLSPAQAGLWLLLALTGTALQALVFEPVKVVVLAVYWTIFRNDIIQ